MKLVKGTYIGVRKRLKGKTAHLREHPKTVTRVLAQFDSFSVPEAFNWHEFSVKDFSETTTKVEANNKTIRG